MTPRSQLQRSADRVQDSAHTWITYEPREQRYTRVRARGAIHASSFSLSLSPPSGHGYIIPRCFSLFTGKMPSVSNDRASRKSRFLRHFCSRSFFLLLLGTWGAVATMWSDVVLRFSRNRRPRKFRSDKLIYFSWLSRAHSFHFLRYIRTYPRAKLLRLFLVQFLFVRYVDN